MLYFFPVGLELEFWAVVEVMTDDAFIVRAIHRQFHFFSQFLDEFCVRLDIAELDLYVLGTWPVAIFAAVGNQMGRFL